MLGHFTSIMPKHSKLSMPADSENSTNGENSPKKGSFQDFKTTSIASNYDLPSTIRSDYPDIIRLGIYFGVYFGVGATGFYAMRDHIRGKKTNDLVDAIYLCVVTMTTVGYGDLVPHNFLSQLMCSVFITVGMCLFGIVVKIAAKYLVMKQQKVLIHALHLSKKLGPMEALRELENFKIDYTKCGISLIAMAAHFVVGIFVLVTVEKMDLDDAVYCVCSTMTTVGFGDESFSSETGRMFGTVWIFTGTSCLGQLFLYIAELYTDIETKKLVKTVISSNMAANTDLEAADNIEANKVDGAADFILYKLKEMGKITREDISLAMKDMDDVMKELGTDDQSGSGSGSDVKK